MLVIVHNRYYGNQYTTAASRDVFLIPKISYIIRHCKFVSQSTYIFLKKNKKTQNDRFFSNWKKKTRRRKKLSLNRVFHKLDNNKSKMHTGARARKQKYISIYISPFENRCIYIYIYRLYKGEWTTYVDLNPLLTRRVSAYAFFRGLNCVRYYS